MLNFAVFYFRSCRQLTMALPNGPMEIVFSFDTTGSMCSCLDEVRSRVADMVQRLQADIPGIKIAIFAHGDYCDSHTYVTKFVDFTDNVVELCDFAKNVEQTGGGDSDECYELVLHEVRTKLSWSPGSQRALVMIGDCNPHEPNYPQNKLKLDWRKEADALGDIDIRIYAVQCKNYGDSEKFYQDIARRTDGQHLRLEDFKNIFDFLMAVCYRERGADFLENYEKEVRARCGPVHKDLNVLFGGLRDSADAASPCGSTTKAEKTEPKVIEATKPPTTIEAKKVKRADLTKPKTAPKAFKVPKAIDKFHVKNLPKLRREKVPEKNFMLSGLPWSKWCLAISPEQNDVTTRVRAGTGYRVPKIFSGKTDNPALYEIGVQSKACGKKFVVFTKFSVKGFDCGKNWERRLFGKSSIRGQLDNVIKHGCKVYIRRSLLAGKRAKNDVKQFLTRYNYAWSENREVVKNSVHISNEMEVDV